MLKRKGFWYRVMLGVICEFFDHKWADSLKDGAGPLYGYDKICRRCQAMK